MDRFSVSSSKPESLGLIEPNILDDLANTVGGELTMYALHQNKRKDNVNSDFLEIVSPITDRFTKYVFDKIGLLPPQIKFRFGSMYLNPGDAHIYSPWHRDTFPSPNQAVAVSSVLTTEFITTEDKEDARHLQRIVLESPDPNKDINMMLAQNKLDIYRPEPYEVATVTANYHRSPTNNTNLPIKRHFLGIMTDFGTGRHTLKITD